jgi:DUF1016 N-terminal domain
MRFIFVLAKSRCVLPLSGCTVVAEKAKIIDRLSEDLAKAFPEMRGFRARNMKHMGAFAEAYSDQEFVQTGCCLLPEYEASVGPIRKLLKSLEGRSEGHPRKIAHLIVRLANSDEVADGMS